MYGLIPTIIFRGNRKPLFNRAEVVSINFGLNVGYKAFRIN
jgi:hypothetical protein